MNEFWDALLKGLTPDSKSDVDMWWKIPLFMFLVILFLGIF
jgi:hypothetical protein